MEARKATPYIQYCKSAINSLVSQYEMSKVIGHSGTAGTVRERLIHDFLESHIPEMTSTVSGVIIDSFGRKSRQQDIVLMLKSMPRLRFNSGHDLIFQEGVVATIEVKTNVTKAVLSKVSESISSIKRLTPTSLGGTQLGRLDWPFRRILHCIVVYGGSSLQEISDAIVDLPEGKNPDIYLDLTKGILIRNEGIFTDKSDGADYLQFDDPGEGLARFLLALAVVTSSYSIRDVKWDQYLLGPTQQQEEAPYSRMLPKPIRLARARPNERNHANDIAAGTHLGTHGPCRGSHRRHRRTHVGARHRRAPRGRALGGRLPLVVPEELI